MDASSEMLLARVIKLKTSSASHLPPLSETIWIIVVIPEYIPVSCRCKVNSSNSTRAHQSERFCKASMPLETSPASFSILAFSSIHV